MNYIVLVHVLSIQTKQNETSNNQESKNKNLHQQKKNIYIGYSLESNVLDTQ